ncbi:MAG TPA: phosphotransferase, partial [Gaiellaceae bacterium]|nr:phosphotransferase [Gaiellaceae bacterium]
MPPPWTDPRWRAEAERWIHDHAEVVAEIEQPHVRPWSTVMRVPTAAGDLWFKAVAPLHRFEPALTEFLAELRPGSVPEVVALDRDRAWMLLRDGGTRLRELPATVEHWARALPAYAELQIAAAPQAAELLELGVPDFRLAKLRGLLQELLSEQPEGLISDEYRAMLDRLPEVESIADRLLAHGIPETIQHDDLHDGQVFVRDGSYLIFDWGDACVSHPFHTLTVTLRAAAWTLELEPGGPDLLRLRDAYLEPFGPPA